MIGYCGPFLGFAFTSKWFPHWLPNYPGLRFVLILCSYDTVISLLDILKGALLADLAVSQTDRSRLGIAASVGQALSAVGLVTISWLFDDNTNTSVPGDSLERGSTLSTTSQEFQSLALFIAIFSAIGLYFGGRCLATLSELPLKSRCTR